MNRRTLLKSAVVAGGAIGMRNSGTYSTISQAGEAPTRTFEGSKLKIAAPIGWFQGETIEQKLEDMARWKLPAYEWLRPEGDLEKIRAKADSLDIKLSAIIGVGAIAEGGMVNPADHDKLVEQFKENIQIGKTLGCKTLLGLSGNTRQGIDIKEQTQAVIACLQRLAPIAEENDITIVMEALNPLVDHKGYFLTRTDQTMAILEKVNSPRVKMLFDIYHQQITEGNVIRNLTGNIKQIGHFHVADNPGRHEPGTGELNYRNIFDAIQKTGYQGYVALEFGPTKGYEAALDSVLDCLV